MKPADAYLLPAFAPVSPPMARFLAERDFASGRPEPFARPCPDAFRAARLSRRERLRCRLRRL